MIALRVYGQGSYWTAEVTHTETSAGEWKPLAKTAPAHSRTPWNAARKALTKWRQMTKPLCVCKHCGHKWRPRGGRKVIPRVRHKCPLCKNVWWRPPMRKRRIAEHDLVQKQEQEEGDGHV